MINETDELRLSGKIAHNPLGRDERGNPEERQADRLGRHVRRAPNPDGPSWRAEDNW